MSKFTKQALIESFLKISAEKPIEKITVRDIVEDCGVNRNTFYYHFADIYALIETLLMCVTEKAVLCSRKEASLSAGCNAIIAWIREHRESFRNIYFTIGRDSVEYAISKVFDNAMLAHVKHRAKGQELVLRESDALLIVDVCRNVFFGALADWMKRGFRNDPSEYLVRIEGVFGDAITDAIRRSAALPPSLHEES